MNVAGRRVIWYITGYEKCIGHFFTNQCQRAFHPSVTRVQPGLTKCIRNWKRTKELDILKNKYCLTLAAYATADHYKLEAVFKALLLEGRYLPCELKNDYALLKDINNAFHVKAAHPNGKDNSHVFFFDVGTVIMWNLTFKQRLEILDLLKQCQVGPYSYKVVQYSSELLSYRYTELKSSFIHDNVLYFGVDEKSTEAICMNRFLFSCAISMTTKMSAFEMLLEDKLRQMEEATTNMRTGKELGIEQGQVLAAAGLTYSTKHALEKSTESLMESCELRELFKFEEERESFCNICCYFGLSKRLKAFNNNLVLCERFTNLLINHFFFMQKGLFQRIILVAIFLGIACVFLKSFG